LPAAVAAFLDVDGTITRTSIVDPLIWYWRAHDRPWQLMLRGAGLLLQAPRYWLIDKLSRGRFNIIFYRRYRGLRADDLRAWHRSTFADNLTRTIFPEARACLEEHRRQGHRLVLVTGALQFVMEPLAEHLHADHLIATRLEERDGILTGALAGLPIADEEKARLARAWAAEQGIDLARSFAYGNNWGDVPMLETAGHAVAVNPDKQLRARAEERGWRVVRWRLK